MGLSQGEQEPLPLLHPTQHRAPRHHPNTLQCIGLDGGRFHRLLYRSVFDIVAAVGRFSSSESERSGGFFDESTHQSDLTVTWLSTEILHGTAHTLKINPFPLYLIHSISSLCRPVSHRSHKPTSSSITCVGLLSFLNITVY